MSRPTTPNALRAALLEAAAAAGARDTSRLEEATAALAVLDPAQLSLVQAEVVRQLLEVLHPDGVDGEDVQQVLADTVRDGAAWWPGTDPDTLLVVLLSALGVAEPDQPAPRLVALAAQATLLVAGLAARQPEPLASFVDRALAEIRRAETMEMP